jgi:hypothetical protein
MGSPLGNPLNGSSGGGLLGGSAEGSTWRIASGGVSCRWLSWRVSPTRLPWRHPWRGSHACGLLKVVPLRGSRYAHLESVPWSGYPGGVHCGGSPGRLIWRTPLSRIPRRGSGRCPLKVHWREFPGLCPLDAVSWKITLEGLPWSVLKGFPWWMFGGEVPLEGTLGHSLGRPWLGRPWDGWAMGQFVHGLSRQWDVLIIVCAGHGPGCS